MATSGVVTLSKTAVELISSAYELARVKDPDETLTDKQSTVGKSSLNKLIKFFQKDGLQLWAIKKDSITLTQSSSSYTCGPSGTGLSERPLRIVEAFYRDGTQDTPLEQVSRQEYYELGDKSTDGRPHQFYYDPQLTSGVLYIYNPADANAAGDTIHLVYHRPFEVINSLTDEFDFPEEWYIVLEYNLAVDLALRNGIKQSRISMLEGKAQWFHDEAIAWSVENVPTQIVPNEN